MKTLVLGLGNPIVADDSVGIRLAREFEARVGARPGVSWQPDCSAGGLNLLDLLAGYDRVVIIDSIRTAGGRPGEWHRFTAGALRETRYLGSIHDANFATTLELGRRIGMALPADDEIHIFAVEIQVHDRFDERMSPHLEAVFPRLRDEILEEILPLLES